MLQMASILVHAVKKVASLNSQQNKLKNLLEYCVYRITNGTGFKFRNCSCHSGEPPSSIHNDIYQLEHWCLLWYYCFNGRIYEALKLNMRPAMQNGTT